MGYKTISTDNSSWTGTSFADNVYIDYADKVRVNTAGGYDSIFNQYGWYETIDAGDGNDTIKSYRGKGSSLVGGAGADLISLSGDAANITVKGGTGNDVIYGDSAAQLFQYANGDGNDVIYNWSANDTLQLTSDGGYSRSTVGNDIVIGFGNGNVTLKGAKGKTVNVKANLGIGFFNYVDNTVVTGTNSTDNIENYGNRVTINTAAGNDSILNSFFSGVGGDYVSIVSGAGNDTIRNNQGFYDTINGGDGADYIYNYRGKNASINGGAGDDLISLSGDSASITIVGGTGNDTIYGDKGAQFFRYASGDGNDVIYNWSANDTISITGGSYTRSTVGSDVVLKVGNGAVTVKGGKNTTVNVKGTLASGGSSNVSIPSGAFTYNGHSYQIYTGATSWEQAQAYCKSRGGHLAVITSSGENTALFNYMKRTGYDSAYFGLSDVSKEGTWTWTNGERVSYTNWASGEPNGGRYENYGMFYYKYSDGKWNDGNFAVGSTFYSGGKKIVDTNAFICEWDTVTGSTPVATGVNINNTTSNKTIYGTSYVDTIKNTGNRVTINTAAGNDSILNTFSSGVGGDYVSIISGAGNDTIRNDQGFYDTINGGDGTDYIYNYRGKNASINGGAGGDLISLSGDSAAITIVGGTGNDTIYGDKAAQLFQYASGDGNDVIYNWSANDTISITGGTYTRSTVGSDVVLKVGYGAITLKGAKNTTVSVKGTLTSGGGNSTIPATQPSGNVIYGTNGHDNITNSIAGAVVYAYGGNDTVYNNSHNNVTIYGGDGADSLNIRYSANVAISGGAGNDKVTVYSGNNASVVGDAGNDTVKVYGTGASISGGEGADYIENDGNNALIYGGNGDDYVDNDGANSTIYAESGNDYIYSYGSNVKVYGGSDNDSIYVNNDSNGFVDGGTGNDTIRARYANNVSLKGNAGNDFIDLYSVSCVIAYNSGDGNDTVTGFDGNDTLKVYGSYTRSTVGNDVVVKVGYGSITLKNAKNSTINISNLSSSADLVGSADLASDDWISADDNNFVTNDTRLDSIVEVPASDYSVGKFDSASTALTAKNIFVAFTGKK